VLFADRERLTTADHQTHRRYTFRVPSACNELRIHVRYTPKFVSPAESERLVRDALESQKANLVSRVGENLAARWAAEYAGAELRVPNLLTISLDDANGRYRGANHRHAEDQDLHLGASTASPGLVPGELPAGEWVLTLSAHTLVSPQCDVEIQIGAEIA
jgi:hypothetical protein